MSLRWRASSCVIEVIVDRLKGNQLGKMVSVDVESRFGPPLLHSALLTALKQTHVSTRSTEQEFATGVIDRLVVYEGEEIGLRVLALTYAASSVYDTIAWPVKYPSYVR